MAKLTEIESWGHRCQILTASQFCWAGDPWVNDAGFLRAQAQTAGRAMGDMLIEQASFREFKQLPEDPIHSRIERRWEVVVVLRGEDGQNAFLAERDNAIQLGREQAAMALRKHADGLVATGLGGCLHVIASTLHSMADKIQKGEIDA